MAAWGVFKPLGLINHGTFLFATVVIFEVLRAFVFNWPRDKKGSWVLLIGIAALALISIYQIFDVILPMIANHITEPGRSYYRVYTWGGTVFIIGMSIFLSYQFARTSKDLEIQLDQVQKLSEKTLRQERQARRRELEKKLLEAENARKTRELEEARKLQLSMLPEKLPELADFNIAVSMKTATEVGGDYYDFRVGEEVTLTVAVGDATGHGMKAGTMVTAAKSLFGTFHESVLIPDFFNHCTRVIKGMNLGKLYMALMILQIRKDDMMVSTAGMPPALIYRKTNNTVEEILLKGPPLGAFSDISYRTRETGFDPGDVVLLMSDGFPERFNQKGEMMGMARVKEAFGRVAEKSPPEIIAALEETGEAWGGGTAQDDDITFVVIKRTWQSEGKS
jgi:serine phosphatase RsbU (regulator of sigma subunit)